MRDWEYVHYCPCGWYDVPSFGDAWFSCNDYPVCPKCGGSCHDRTMETGRMVRQPKAKWWHLATWKFTLMGDE